MADVPTYKSCFKCTPFCNFSQISPEGCTTAPVAKASVPGRKVWPILFKRIGYVVLSDIGLKNPTFQLASRKIPESLLGRIRGNLTPRLISSQFNLLVEDAETFLSLLPSVSDNLISITF
ncbi:unnamed protein product [Nezara viridula]|uniref:Uncharacterized protein n=1 Tax=Nezara viridula TaxID=85310 RepID=A0A9P0MXS5_NEZVI|nr:unnamed protein product [Nezara viridula]